MRKLFGLTLALVVVPASVLLGQPVVFQAHLMPGAEVPAVASGTPSGASGIAVLILTHDQDELLFAINYSGLSGPARASHFHRAAQGESGSVIHGICGGNMPSCPGGTGGSITDVWSGVSAEIIEDLQSGRLYLNFHTARNRPGEIRGQILP